MYDYTIQQLVLRLAALLLFVALQGGVVAATAVALGDKGVRHDRRLNLDPLVHLDLIGLVTALFFSVGWIRPIAVDPGVLRGGRSALVLPVLAGFVATLALILLLLVLRTALLPWLPDTAAQTLFALVSVAGPLGLNFALANLLPIPPFTGGLLLQAASPALARALLRWPVVIRLLILGLAWLGLLGSLLAPAEQLLALMLLRQ